MPVWLERNRSLIYLRLLQISLCTFVLGIKFLANISLFFLMAIWLVDSGLLNKIKRCIRDRFFWIVISYFLITLIGVAYSENHSDGFRMVGMRWYFIVMPLVLFGMDMNRKQFDQILKAFLFICLLAFVIGLINAFVNYLKTSDSGYFYNDNLVSIVKKQATYFAIYINFCLVLTYDLFRRSIFKGKGLFIAIVVILIICQLLLAVRIAILTTGLMLLAYTFNILFKKSIKTGLSIIVMLCISVFIAGSLFPQMGNRFRSMTSNFNYRFDNPNPINHFNGKIDKNNWNGLTVRLALWQCGIDIIRQHPLFGVGTGDYSNEMNKQFDQKNFIYAREMGFGVHNQYLYSWISFGVPGLLILIGSLLFPLHIAIREKQIIFILFISIIGIAMITENVFNRYYGIYFYGVMNSLLFFRFYPNRLT